MIRTLVDAGESNGSPEQLVRFLAEQFAPLFDMGHDPTVHPLMRGISERLQDVPAAVSLTARDGVIERTGVRHLVLRATTFVLLLEAIPADRVRRVAVRIGKTAALDLVQHALRRHLLVPKSAWALVELWNYWDRTGGWGRYSLSETTLDDEDWRIRVENNFLPMNTDQQVALSDRFWCGYIHGFLNEAMPDLMELMLRVDSDQRQELLLPVGKRVEDVVRDRGRSGQDGQVYVVSFHDEPLSEALKCLVHSYAELYSPSANEHSAQNAVMWAARALLEAERGDASRYANYVGHLDDATRAKIERVRRYLTTALPTDTGSARDCYRVVADAVHQLVRMSPEMMNEQPNF